jgi:hypothetical protein
MIGAVCTSPLDVVKTRLQASVYHESSPASKRTHTNSKKQSTYYQQLNKSNAAVAKHTTSMLGHFVETGRLLV